MSSHLDAVYFEPTIMAVVQVVMGLLGLGDYVESYDHWNKACATDLKLTKNTGQELTALQRFLTYLMGAHQIECWTAKVDVLILLTTHLIVWWAAGAEPMSRRCLRLLTSR